MRRVVFRGRSALGRLLVTDEPGGIRALWVGEDDAVQSLVRPGNPDRLVLPYLKAMVAALALCPRPERILVVGLGGGSLPVWLRRHFPRALVEVVEIDPLVRRVARRHFGVVEDAQLRVIVDDAARFLRRSRREWDLIVLDAFAGASLPPQLATEEFLGDVRQRLAPGGALLGNLWSQARSAGYPAHLRRWAAVFPVVHVVRAERSCNRILVVPQRAWRRGPALAAAASLRREHSLRFDPARILARGLELTPAGSRAR